MMEDNEYLPGVDPSLEFVITSKDITATGASSTLLIFNNERGFSEENINSICNIGHSTKKGKRQCGYIGEEGPDCSSVGYGATQEIGPFIIDSDGGLKFNPYSWNKVLKYIHIIHAPIDIHTYI